jgi:hypothetical protein
MKRTAEQSISAECDEDDVQFIHGVYGTLRQFANSSYSPYLRSTYSYIESAQSAQPDTPEQVSETDSK